MDSLRQEDNAQQQWFALNASEREVVRAAIEQFNFVDINMTELGADNALAASLFFRRGLPLDPSRVADGYGPYVGASTAVITSYQPIEKISPVVLPHELMHSLAGTSHTGSRLNYQRRGLPVAGFADSAIATVMGPPHPCLSATGLGPLDKSLLVNLYGLARPLRGDTTHIIDGQTGVVGMIDTDGNNTLEAHFAGRVFLSLDSANVSASIVGASFVTLAPGSRMRRGDLSGTAGGILMGDSQSGRLEQSTLIGSDFDDIFVPGSGATTIITGSGEDWIVLDDSPSAASQRVIVQDFTPGVDKLGLLSNVTDEFQVQVNAATNATNLSLRNGAEFTIQTTFEQFKPARDVQASFSYPKPTFCHHRNLSWRPDTSTWSANPPTTIHASQDVWHCPASVALYIGFAIIALVAGGLFWRKGVRCRR
ncbi:MAG: hypothetical protein EOO77_21860 [Oxalobacteraceae bacterium]|nr:MAG: hypothetical protein EOO77_21860 [Oxalobacteraceae bacterium]